MSRQDGPVLAPVLAAVRNSQAQLSCEKRTIPRLGSGAVLAASWRLGQDGANPVPMRVCGPILARSWRRRGPARNRAASMGGARKAAYRFKKQASERPSWRI